MVVNKSITEVLYYPQIVLMQTLLFKNICKILNYKRFVVSFFCPISESTGLSMGMGFPWDGMGWDGMGLHALYFPWDLWDSSHVIVF